MGRRDGGEEGRREREGGYLHESWSLSMGTVSLCYSINAITRRPASTTLLTSEDSSCCESDSDRRLRHTVSPTLHCANRDEDVVIVSVVVFLPGGPALENVFEAPRTSRARGSTEPWPDEELAAAPDEGTNGTGGEDDESSASRSTIVPRVANGFRIALMNGTPST